MQYSMGENNSLSKTPALLREPGMEIPISAKYASADVGRSISPFSVLFSRKGTIILFAIVGLALGTLLVWNQKYVYRGHASLEVMRMNDDLLGKRELDPNVRQEDSFQVSVNTVAKLLQSGPLYARVAAQLNQPVVSTDGGTAAPWDPPITVKEITNTLKVATHDTDRIVEVTAESTDPKRAAAIVNGLTSSFIQQDVESRRDASTNTSGWLRTELDNLSAKLRSSENTLEAFTKQSDLLLDGDSGGVADSFARNIQAGLAQAEADRVNKESLYQDAKAGGALATLPIDPALEQYELQLNTLQKQLADLETTFTPDYHLIPPIRAQIAQVEKAIAGQRKSVLTRLENDYHAAAKREDTLRNQYDIQLRSATDQTSKMVQYAALKNEVEMNRNIYALMMQKVKGYSVASAMQATDVRVVDPAIAPLLPVSPNKPLIAVGMSMGFLALGAFWVLARAGANRTIMEPGESQQYLRAPELGVIPSASRAALRGDQLQLNGAPLAEIPHLGRSKQSRLETVTWRSSPSLMAESFRSASASLLLPTQGKGEHRVLVITSVSPSEGKTTVASNIAIALAGVAGRVLLIDGDRRRARLHNVFGCRNDKGLTDLLQPEPDTTMTPEECITETAIPNLSLLPSGRNSLRSSDLLYSARMTDLIGRVRSQFDVVLIDTPPLMHLSDARVLGRLSDGVILVIRAGRVPWESAIAAEQRLADDGITVLGTVLNDWDPKKSGYGIYPYNKHVESYFAA